MKEKVLREGPGFKVCRLEDGIISYDCHVDDCGKSFLEPDDLEEHLRRFHGKEVKVRPWPYGRDWRKS